VNYGRVDRARRALYQSNPNAKREGSLKVGREHALALEATNESNLGNNKSSMKNNESSMKNNESNMKDNESSMKNNESNISISVYSSGIYR
jgi:hypothetical protein